MRTLLLSRNLTRLVSASACFLSMSFSIILLQRALYLAMRNP